MELTIYRCRRLIDSIEHLRQASSILQIQILFWHFLFIVVLQSTAAKPVSMLIDGISFDKRISCSQNTCRMRTVFNFSSSIIVSHCCNGAHIQKPCTHINCLRFFFRERDSAFIVNTKRSKIIQICMCCIGEFIWDDNEQMISPSLFTQR